MFAVFASDFLCIRFFRAVGSQVSKFMRHPVSQGVIAHVAVAVDERASAGQMREHGAGISSGHVETKCSGRVNVLPVGHKENSQRKNVGLHDPNLSAYQSFLLGRSSQDCVAVCGSFRCGCFCQ